MRNRDDLLFPLSEYERRLNDLRQRMEVNGLDAVIITTPENIFYLSGFESPGHYYFNSLVVPLRGEPFMSSRLLEASGIEALTWVELLRPYEDIQDPMQVLGAALVEFGLSQKRIGFEEDCWFFTAVQQKRLFANCPAATLLNRTMKSI